MSEASLTEQQKAEIEEELDTKLEKEGLTAKERKQSLKKLYTMEKHERQGYILEIKMLKHLNEGDPAKRRLQYKAGMNMKDMIKSRDPDSKRTFDEFFIDQSIREHLDKILCPITERVNEMLKTVNTLKAQNGLNEDKIKDMFKKLEEMKETTKRCVEQESQIKL